MADSPIITLLTDFGMSDHYVAAMKGVMLGICPAARLVDISHLVAAYGIQSAAFLIAQAAPCFPAGTIHLIVVDPGVGSARRPLLVQAREQYFVAPDNGVLTMIFESDPAARAREITASRYFRHPVSHTFHGRDIFAPVAAHLAAGVPAEEFGSRVAHPVQLASSRPVLREDGSWVGRVIHVDRFGNLITNFRMADLPDLATVPFKLVIGEHVGYQYCTSYTSASGLDLFVIEGSSGHLEVSFNQRDASAITGAIVGTVLTLHCQ